MSFNCVADFTLLVRQLNLHSKPNSYEYNSVEWKFLDLSKGLVKSVFKGMQGFSGESPQACTMKRLKVALKGKSKFHGIYVTKVQKRRLAFLII